MNLIFDFSDHSPLTALCIQFVFARNPISIIISSHSSFQSSAEEETRKQWSGLQRTDPSGGGGKVGVSVDDAINIVEDLTRM